MNLKECASLCLRNCSCTAYANSDIRAGSGCLLWFDDLIDMRELSITGQEFYVRMAASELGMHLSFVYLKNYKSDTNLMVYLVKPFLNICSPCICTSGFYPFI